MAGGGGGREGDYSIVHLSNMLVSKYLFIVEILR